MFLSQLFEAVNKQHAAFCFGRMNPPTIGHDQLIKTVGQAAGGGDYFIFTSQTQDAKKNPLDYQTKVRFLRALYPGMASHFVYEPGLKTIMQVAEWLYKKGYRTVTFVAGSDRLPDFQELLNKYNGHEGGAVYYKFDTINFVSSGDRDPDSEGIEGVSASAAREAAKAGNYEAFAQAVDAGALTQQMYDAVRKGLGVSDAVDEGWKDAAIGAAMLGTIGGGAMYAQQRPTIEVDGSKWIITNRAPDYKARDSKIVTADDGKKYLIWRGIKGRRRASPIDEPTQQPQQQKQERWREPTEIEPTDMWVNEDASGYIPKNKKEAKDPRWSNALSVDVKPDTPTKNAKALRLA